MFGYINTEKYFSVSCKGTFHVCGTPPQSTFTLTARFLVTGRLANQCTARQCQCPKACKLENTNKGYRSKDMYALSASQTERSILSLSNRFGTVISQTLAEHYGLWGEFVNPCNDALHERLSYIAFFLLLGNLVNKTLYRSLNLR
jgi:hypothetical protein